MKYFINVITATTNKKYELYESGEKLLRGLKSTVHSTYVNIKKDKGQEKLILIFWDKVIFIEVWEEE